VLYKCQDTTDNLKQMSRLTINFNLIYITFFNLPRPATATAATTTTTATA